MRTAGRVPLPWPGLSSQAASPGRFRWMESETA
jgi:hypothetical protein